MFVCPPSQTLRAQGTIDDVQILVMALLGLEGVGLCVGSFFAVLLVLRALMAHRKGMFSIFLALPNVALRTLANKSTNIGDDEDSDDGEAHARGWGRILVERATVAGPLCIAPKL